MAFRKVSKISKIPLEHAIHTASERLLADSNPITQFAGRVAMLPSPQGVVGPDGVLVDEKGVMSYDSERDLIITKTLSRYVSIDTQSGGVKLMTMFDEDGSNHLITPPDQKYKAYNQSSTLVYDPLTGQAEVLSNTNHSVEALYQVQTLIEAAEVGYLADEGHSQQLDNMMAQHPGLRKRADLATQATREAESKSWSPITRPSAE